MYRKTSLSQLRTGNFHYQRTSVSENFCTTEFPFYQRTPVSEIFDIREFPCKKRPVLENIRKENLCHVGSEVFKQDVNIWLVSCYKDNASNKTDFKEES